ncbi:Nostrin [Armadillidium vulgare]|nr:Nostrin [Armadillidium vulgare]
MVDKATKNLHDWRTAEMKAKKNCYHNARENEKIQDIVLDSRLGRGRSISDKEMVKLEKQRRKAEEAVQKSDVEYYSYCIRTERARQEWESAVYKGSNCFQTLEEERLAALKDLILKYHKTNKDAAPKLVAIASRLDEPVSLCDVDKDIQTVITAKGTGEHVPQQYLPDFYSEDLNNVMNKARRREALEKFLKLIRSDIERERRGKQGVENLAKALQETPNFGGEDSQQDVNDKLQNMKAMLAYLEASRYKVQTTLNDINCRPKVSHPLAKHIETHRDKQGLPISILKVPPWIKGTSPDISPLSESPTIGSPNWNDRGTADGTSVQPDSDFVEEPSHVQSSSSTAVAPPRAFMYPVRYPSLILSADEFSSQGSDHPDYQTEIVETGQQVRNQKVLSQSLETRSVITEEPVNSSTNRSIPGAPADGMYFARPLTTTGGITMGRCKALYDYEANLYDELSIRTGDIINIHEKQPDGWWIGEVEGNVGIFPATYVEEID